MCSMLITFIASIIYGLNITKNLGQFQTKKIYKKMCFKEAAKTRKRTKPDIK